MRRLLFFYLIGQSLCFAGITEKKNELGPPLTLSVGDSLHLSNHIEKLSKKKNSNSIVVNMICHKKKKGRDFRYKCSPFELKPLK
jgi:hypothetical protein